MNKALIACSLLLQAGAAFAVNGFVGNPLLDKPQYLAGENATLTVQGVGTCKNIEIQWGDGKKDSYPTHNFGAAAGAMNLVATHQFAAGGNYNIKVSQSPGLAAADLCGNLNATAKVMDQGKIGKLTITPTSALTGNPVDIRFDGSGACSGDAVIAIAYQEAGQMKRQAVSAVFGKDAAWPRVAAFVPTVPGMHWVYMAPPANLQQSNSVGCYGAPAGGNTVNVQPKPAITIHPAAIAANANTNAGAPPKLNFEGLCPNPTVQSLLVGGPLKPGSSIIVGGCGFGELIGEVRLLGKFPNGHVVMKINSWGEKGIGAVLPESITGATSQMAAVQVITKAGKASNQDKTVQFEAQHVRKMISLHETDNNCKKHQGLYGMEFESTCATFPQTFQGGPCPATVCAQQKGKPVINDVVKYGGPDEYQLKLKNGWVYDGYEFWSDSGADFAGPFTPPVGPKPNASVVGSGANAKVVVNWEAFRPTGWVKYHLKIFVKGPVGVPSN